MKGKVNITFFSHKPEADFFIGSKLTFAYYEGNKFLYQYIPPYRWEPIEIL
jgi:hypothetical protein